MSVEVRVCLEVGLTDGDTAVRVLLTETVLPQPGGNEGSDLAELARAALSRIASDALDRAMEQADVFVYAMRLAEVDDDGNSGGDP